MKLLRGLASMTIILFLPACASVLAGTHKTVRVTSDPPGALIKIDGVTRSITPGAVHPSTRSDHQISIVLAGYEPYEVHLVRRLSRWQWANVVTGLAPGIAFDGATGAVYSFEPSIDAKLQRLGTVARK